MSLEFEQHRPGLRLKFTFSDEELTYSIKELGSEHRFSTDYEHIFVETPAYVHIDNYVFARRWGWVYLAFVGVIGLGLYWRVPAFALGAFTVLGISAWMLVRLRNPFSIHFVTLTVALDAFSGQSRQLQIIDDGLGAKILEEIALRRRQRLRALYAFVDADADPQREVAKFEWLKANQVIDDAEFQAALAELQGMEPSDRSVH